jgi:hypothetical protein
MSDGQGLSDETHRDLVAVVDRLFGDSGAHAAMKEHQQRVTGLHRLVEVEVLDRLTVSVEEIEKVRGLATTAANGAERAGEALRELRALVVGEVRARGQTLGEAVERLEARTGESAEVLQRLEERLGALQRVVTWTAVALAVVTLVALVGVGVHLYG